MKIIKTSTYQQSITEPRLLEISKECASVYNLVLNTFWDYFKENDGDFLSANELQAIIYHNLETKYIGSSTKIAVIQKFREAITGWIKAKKKDPTNRDIQPPYKEKEIYAITFKNHSIKRKKNHLELSLLRGNDPIKVKWNPELSTPIYATINYNPSKGWKVSFVIDQVTETKKDFDETKLLACDLGVKRTVTTFDGEKTTTYSGKKILSLMRLRNKVDAEIKEKLSKLKKHGLKYKKIKRAYRKITNRNQNQINDILHKMSKTIVNDCVNKNIGKIVFGDCAGIHDGVDCGKENNQKINQNPEQKLRKFVEQKFEDMGGTTIMIPEPYTSRTCPCCHYVKTSSVQGRFYYCQECGFVFDRDGVGSINIWNLEQKVSFGITLDVVGGLTPPIGWKYKSNRDCLTLNGSLISKC